MQQQIDSQGSLVISYLALRKAIGILGTLLPFTVSLGALVVFRTGLQSSLSGYYYTGMRDVFVGTLWAIGFFLMSYRGYDRVDNIAANLGCIFALGVALFPTTPDMSPSSAARWIGWVHLAFASLFFSTLIFFSLFQFTKSGDPQSMTDAKRMRNRVYRVCGYTMAVCILLILVYFILRQTGSTFARDLDPIFWLEAIAIVAFGVSWLTKGEAILKDSENALQ